MKTCIRCMVSKPDADYSRNRTRYELRCKRCRADLQAQRRVDHSKPPKLQVGHQRNVHQMTTANTAWLAGLFEGEGTLTASTTRPKQVAFSISMSDRDVIEALHDLTGIGKVYKLGVVPGREHHKPMFRWSVNRRQDVVDLIYLILPFLFERRRATAQEMLNRLEGT